MSKQSTQGGMFPLVNQPAPGGAPLHKANAWWRKAKSKTTQANRGIYVFSEGEAYVARMSPGGAALYWVRAGDPSALNPANDPVFAGWKKR